MPAVRLRLHEVREAASLPARRRRDGTHPIRQVLHEEGFFGRGGCGLRRPGQHRPAARVLRVAERARHERLQRRLARPARGRIGGGQHPRRLQRRDADGQGDGVDGERGRSGRVGEVAQRASRPVPPFRRGPPVRGTQQHRARPLARKGQSRGGTLPRRRAAGRVLSVPGTRRPTSR